MFISCINCKNTYTNGLKFSDDLQNYNLCNLCINYYFNLMKFNNTRQITDPVFSKSRILNCNRCNLENHRNSWESWIYVDYVLIWNGSKLICWCLDCWEK